MWQQVHAIVGHDTTISNLFTKHNFFVGIGHIVSATVHVKWDTCISDLFPGL